MFEPGQQIQYVPLHANGDPDHRDIEYGFVVRPAGDEAYFCRYWKRGQPGTLRTLENSESTPTVMLSRRLTVRQDYVERLMIQIEKGEL